MGEALLTGSALAAFLAGMVAFFAPCCAFVLLPTYLASVTGASRWRTAALTAVFVAGVATIVWPLTVGAAGVSQRIAANHETMFVLGGVMMLLVGAATLRGWMWNHAPSVGGGDPSGVLGIYGMGVFAGAATACCAPVLAGAVAIAGVSGSWWAGGVLGAFYLFGLVAPLLLSAAGIGKLRGRLRDPQVTFTVLGRRVRSTVSRLLGGVAFLGLGALLFTLALTGNARTAPVAQKDFGQWLTARANDLNDPIPPGAGWALMLAVAAGVIYVSVRALRHPQVAMPATPAPSMTSHLCCEEDEPPQHSKERPTDVSPSRPKASPPRGPARGRGGRAQGREALEADAPRRLWRRGRPSPPCSSPSPSSWAATAMRPPPTPAARTRPSAPRRLTSP